ncbi:MAG: radical SAM protein [Candidatus Omnitrophica bacterium]|nr:radical SAM protein [Candidatus Omnitrophota bacterium]
MSSIRFDEKDNYIERLEKKIFSQGRPVSGQIDVTYQCNLKCQHCFIKQEEYKKELEFDEITRIINDIKKAGCLWLCLSGGEPFLRKDFLDIYTYARKRGFLISIFTNGTLITPRIADCLAEFPPYSIEITLNGLTKKVYEEVTQIKGSFIRVMRAIEMIKERGLPLVLKSNGMKINRDEILKITKFSEELLGKKRFRCDLVLYPGIDGSKKPCSLRLTPDEILNIQYSDNEMLSLCREQFLHHKENARLKEGYLFPCGLTSFHIDPYGEMRLCSFIKEEYADLKEEEFLKGFIRLYSKLTSLKAKKNTKCRDCKIDYLCRQCPGRALVENGDMESPVEFYCELAHKQEEMKEEVVKKVL